MCIYIYIYMWAVFQPRRCGRQRRDMGPGRSSAQALLRQRLRALEPVSEALLLGCELGHMHADLLCKHIY